MKNVLDDLPEISCSEADKSPLSGGLSDTSFTEHV